MQQEIKKISDIDTFTAFMNGKQDDYYILLPHAFLTAGNSKALEIFIIHCQKNNIDFFEPLLTERRNVRLPFLTTLNIINKSDFLILDKYFPDVIENYKYHILRAFMAREHFGLINCITQKYTDITLFDLYGSSDYTEKQCLDMFCQGNLSKQTQKKVDFFIDYFNIDIYTPSRTNLNMALVANTRHNDIFETIINHWGYRKFAQLREKNELSHTFTYITKQNLMESIITPKILFFIEQYSQEFNEIDIQKLKKTLINFKGTQADIFHAFYKKGFLFNIDDIVQLFSDAYSPNMENLRIIFQYQPDIIRNSSAINQYKISQYLISRNFISPLPFLIENGLKLEYNELPNYGQLFFERITNSAYNQMTPDSQKSFEAFIYKNVEILTQQNFILKDKVVISEIHTKRLLRMPKMNALVEQVFIKQNINQNKHEPLKIQKRI